MTVFKGHKIQVNQLLEAIPNSLLVNLSSSTNVDRYAKVLHGTKMFYLLLYGIIENEKLSQRTLEDSFSDPVFKLLFDLDKTETVSRSSISERLSKIDSNFFRQIYECIYEQFSKTYSESDRNKYNLIRVDSTIVTDTAGKMAEGIGNNGKKAVKFSVALDNHLPCELKAFTSSSYCSEDIALPEVILNHVKKESNHQNIYVLDRGLQSTRTMNDFNKKSIKFICRAKENRKYEEQKSLIAADTKTDLDDSILIKDSIVKLYTGVSINNKKGNIHYREELVENEFRLVVIKSKSLEGNEFWFLSNNFELSAEEIATLYRKRWDIEVFFRFLKQELNVSHLVSLNKNGMEVMMYMTLIVAMLVLIYKKANNVGYKTAKRRFSMEVRNLAIALIVMKCGGNHDLFFKT